MGFFFEGALGDWKLIYPKALLACLVLCDDRKFYLGTWEPGGVVEKGVSFLGLKA